MHVLSKNYLVRYLFSGESTSFALNNAAYVTCDVDVTQFDTYLKTLGAIFSIEKTKAKIRSIWK